MTTNARNFLVSSYRNNNDDDDYDDNDNDLDLRGFVTHLVLHEVCYKAF
jgi:hypothetical protein